MSSVDDECSEGTSWRDLEIRSHRRSLMKDYAVLHPLGRGGFGTVLLAEHRGTGMLVAVKVLEKNKLKLTSTTSEVKILKDLQHPNIVQLLEVLETERELLLVLEYVRGRDLWQYIAKTGRGRLLEEEARALFRELVEAVQYCHDLGIVHGDLKPGNILMDTEGHPKLSDFGLGFRFHPGQKVTAPGGTLYYCAPEVFLGGKHQGPPVDAWSLGIILYEVVAGYCPFLGRKQQVIQKALGRRYVFPTFFSTELKSLISELLTPNPRMRPTLNQVLQHGWLCGAPSRSPPKALSKSMKTSILNVMAGMGYNPLKVIDALRYKKFNKQMVTFLLLQDQALQGLGFRVQVKPRHPAEDLDLEEAPSSSTDLTSSSPLPSRRASEPAPRTEPFFSGVKLPGQQGDRGSPTLTPISKIPVCDAPCQPSSVASSACCQPSCATPSMSCQPSSLSPNLHCSPSPGILSRACQPSPGASQPSPGASQPSPGASQPSPGASQPSPGASHSNSCTGAAPASSGRRGWKAVKRRITGCLQALCCCPLPAWGRRLSKVAPL
ncbi:PREDICTED: sperm motility kinase 2B-like [Chinchilla lanigera]|uniref:sperm motility kinase 2B-like n=1 Tax=Chinchilla lanigera TaxID=34839 RepID=UPI00038EB67D|nr:PREDICTED: sperm motility kinase 2B-like [Chinchilla lanigera]XP_013370975.1 PREDICTED: sperm motility kinase 2B-like [Chinchilla lanigera]XP_013370976.1 PREDICTED: sperm motility kinase 2B-like [Chinchilla lanigera]XP_013370977.1 PREDICTED: sperm motility kinase 2B-like [Chinchilla lanigera]XP_013370978.1 PREDICTED: sperm motility kinase 2B-like [Chinchilla lanigera]XP_013370979.1 PREDICTED: sperm motility kinase 2B-like [Chinchilla lanigera]XP_013370980.1 PREDICTED: sperm motility kinase